MSDREFYLLFGLIATALFVLHAAVDHYRTRRRARRLHTGPNLTLPPREKSSHR